MFNKTHYCLLLEISTSVSPPITIGHPIHLIKKTQSLEPVYVDS